MQGAEKTAFVRLVTELQQTDEVVIYCGAGVTLSHTGVSWNDLLLRVAQHARAQILSAACDGDEDCLRELGEGVEEFVYSSSNSAEASASAIMNLAAADEASVGPAVSQALYFSTGWQVGRLVDDVCFLILSLQQLGKAVRILTTNFDTFIEDRLGSLIDALRANGVDPLPAVCRRVYGAKTAGGDSSREAVRTCPMGRASDGVTPIVVEYLHGRVDEAGSVEGGLVLSERSYQATQSQTQELLTGAFGDAVTLILGSSLTDAPLLRSLCNVERDSAYGRFAVVRRAPKPGAQKMAQARARHLDLSLIEVATYADVARVVRDAEYALMNLGAGSGENSERQLARWRALGEPSEAARARLLEQMRDVIRSLKQSGVIGNELLKLEAWVLRSFRGEDALERVLDTVSGDVECEYRRLEPIENPREAVAAVRALRDGRPLVVSLDDLGFDDEGVSRWRSICAVPCWYSLDETSDTPITVVVTLASTGKNSEVDDSGLFDRANSANTAAERFQQVARAAASEENSQTLRERALDTEAESFLWHLTPAGKADLYYALFDLGVEIAGAYWAGE
ncbi:SIR2 family protein [Buchananella felis]|uniref:SIR2 family protein n=1 Tax=Buchananella felis TaxID=3231492 RepID=UPI00352950AB